MLQLYIAICFSLNLLSITAIAGTSTEHVHGRSHGHTSKHDHPPVNQVTDIQIATDKIADLIDDNVLDKSWAAVIAKSAKKNQLEGMSVGRLFL